MYCTASELEAAGWVMAFQKLHDHHLHFYDDRGALDLKKLVKDFMITVAKWPLRSWWSKYFNFFPMKNAASVVQLTPLCKQLGLHRLDSRLLSLSNCISNRSIWVWPTIFIHLSIWKFQKSVCLHVARQLENHSSDGFVIVTRLLLRVQRSDSIYKIWTGTQLCVAKAT